MFEAFDYLLLVCVLALVATGIAFIYSSGINSDGILVTNEYIKQIVWASVGLVFVVFFAFYDYRRFERYVRWLYAGLLLVLIYTRIFGRYVNGARSWIGLGDFGIQPSEFGKVIFIFMLARYLSNSVQENQIKRLVVASLILAGPAGLILIQPDFGTASVYIPIFFIMCFLAGIPGRYLLFMLGAGVSAIVFTVLPVWNEYIMHGSAAFTVLLTNSKIKIAITLLVAVLCSVCMVFRHYFHGAKYFYWIAYALAIITLGLLCSVGASKVMKPYQIQRLIVFMDPSVDPLGSGWNIIQSKIAIGSGGVFGRSFLHGTQSHYRFLPQQSTDFIFSILSEEWGFAGGIFILLLFMIVIIRTLYIIRNCQSRFGTYIAAGILGMFVIHFFINVGMVMGMMPITGIPLLFLSYGGSSLLTAMSCVGILMSISSHKFHFSS